MKRYLKLIVLALLLSVFSVSYAATVQIGDGNDTTNGFPITGVYGYTYSQQIYTQAQIGTGGEITKIRFYYASGSIATSKDWVIYMGHTDKTSFTSDTDWEAYANLTQVFNGDVSSLLPAANNWMEITLDVPFTYNNTQNLIIAVDENTPSYSSMSWGAFTSGTNTGLRFYSDSVNPDPTNPPTTGYHFSRSGDINRIQLVFPDTVAPDAPTLLSPENGGQIMAGMPLSWTLPSGSADATGYDVYIDGTIASSDQPDTSYNLPSGLTEGTHTWYVIARNNIGTSPASATGSFEFVNGVIIGTGTSQQNYPFHIHYGYGRSLGLYTAAQIGEYGVINTLGWSVSSTSTSAVPYKIYAMVVDASQASLSQMTWSDFTDVATLVKDGTSTPYTFDTPGWHQFTLDTPFTYAGGNLLIGVEANYGGYGTSPYPQFHYTSTGTNTHQYWRQDGGAPIGNGYLNSSLPNLLMLLSPLPANPVFSINPTGWDFGRTQLNATGSKTFTITNAGGGLLSVNTVTPASTGFFSVTDITNMPGSLATGETASFTINYSPTEVGNHYATFRVGHGNGLDDVLISGECFDPAISSFPYTENFDGTWSGTPAAPEAWTVINANSDSYTWRQSAQWLTPRSEPYVAHGMGNTNDWLITPPINLSGVNVKMKWWDRVESSSRVNSYKVYVSTTTPEIASFTNELIDINCSNTVWTERELNLAAYNGQTIYVAFYQYASPSTSYAFGIDDFSLEELPTTPVFSLDPTDWDFGRTMINTTGTKTFTIMNDGGGVLTVTGISPASSGHFSVTGAPSWPVDLAAGESATFNIEYTPTAVGTHTATFTISDGRAITNLTVNGECYDPVISSFPYTENFDGTWSGSPAAPDCWTVINANSDSYTWRQSNQYLTARSAPYLAHGMGNTNDWLITPPINLSGVNVRMKWWDRVESSSYPNSYKVYVSTTTPEIASFATELTDITCSNTAWTEHELNLSAYNGQTIYVAFYQYASPATYYAFGIDDFSLEELPTTPIFSMEPTEWDFGSRQINSTTSKAFTITNTGVGILNVADISPASSGYFSVTEAPAWPVALATGESTTFNIEYTPTAVGAHSATFTISHTGGSTGLIVDGVCYDPTISTFPWAEDFTNTTFPPEEWGRYQGLYPTESLTPVTYGWSRASNFAGDASNPSARINIWGSSRKHWLVTPPLAIPATGYQLDFDVALTTYSGGNPVDPSQQQDDRFIVLISDQPDMTGAQILREWNNTGSEFVYNNIATQGEYQAIDLSSHVGAKYIGFYGESTASGGDVYLYLDNVRVRETPATPVFVYTPDTINFGTTLANTPTEYQSVTVNNTGGGTLELPIANVSIIGTDAAMFAFDPENLPFAITLGQAGTIPVRYQPTAEGAHSATLRMVYNGTDYDVALSGNALSEFALLESFEGTQFPPVGWSVHNGGGANTWVRSTSTPRTGAAHASILYNSVAHDDWLITPKLMPSATNHTFSFYGNSLYGYDERFNVLVSTTDAEITSFTNTIASDVSTGAGTYMLHSYSLSAYIGQQIYVAIQAISTNQYYLLIDDVSGPDVVVEPPTVPVLVAPADGATMVSVRPTLTWNAGEGGIPSGYRVYLDTSNPPTTPVADVATTSYTFTSDLQADTEYFWTVEAYNSAATSAAATPFSFTTTPAGVIIIGDGNEFNGTGSYPAVYGGWYRNAREQYIITAAELNAAGAQAGYLASIAFNVETPNNCGALNNFTIKMGTTTATEFANTSFIGGSTQEGLTQVFNVVSYQPIAGWNTHTLDTPFNWDGTSNLVVQVSFGMQSSYSQNASTYYTTTSTHQAMYYRDDNTAWDTVSTGTRSNKRPNMMMVQPPDTAPAVPTLASPLDGAIDLPKEGFDLMWNPDIMHGGMPAGYTVYLATDASTIYDEYYWEVANTHFNPVLDDTDYGFSFAYGQRYYWTVEVYNDHGSAVADPPFFFEIEADPTVSVYPWTENFDALNNFEMPRHWTVFASQTGDDDRGWIAFNHPNIGATSAPNSAVVFYHPSFPKDEWMITNPFSMQAGVHYNISFTLRAPGGTEPEAMAVHWGTEPTVAAMIANPALFDENDMRYENWTPVNIRFVPNTTGIYYFGWHAKTPVTLNYIAVDDITIDLAPANDLAVVAVGGDAFGNIGLPVNKTVSVMNLGSAAQNNYTVYIKEDITNNVLAQQTITETINPGETVVHTLSWTPAATGVVSIYAEVALASDTVPANDITAPMTIPVYGADIKVLYVGDPHTSWRSTGYPFNVYYHDFVAETIYLGSEIQAQNGTIQALAYYNNFTTAQSIPVQVWMQNTTATDATGGWLPWADYQLVFDGTIDCPAGVNEIMIQLDTPFIYTGGNIAIRTSRTWENGYTANQWWRVTDLREILPNRTRFYAEDSDAELDHTNPPEGNAGGYVPNVCFIMATDNLVSTVATPVPTVTTDATGPVLSWEAVPYAYSYNIYATADPYDFSAADAITVYTNTVPIDASTADKLFFKVTSNTYRDYGRAQGILRNPLSVEVLDVEENLIQKAKREIQRLSPIKPKLKD